MLTALLVTIIATFSFLTLANWYANMNSSKSKLVDVRQKLANNDATVAQLTETLGQNNLAKARAFAGMLAEDTTIENNFDRLTEITDRLMVNEVHIIDEEGIITNSSVEAYIGFDMKSGEQSRAFMVLVDDPSMEIVQEPQKNSAEGTMMQYIGVGRTDAKGFVQVGVRPEALEQTLAGTDISVVLEEIDFGKNGYIYAIDAESGQLTAHPNKALIGTSAAEAGFSPSFTGSGRIKVEGKSGYYYAEENDGMIIGTFLPASEFYATRRNQTLLMSCCMLIIFSVLLVLINRMVDSKIVCGLNNITASMKKIADGCFDITVDEKGNPEFELLSESINTMVESICRSTAENESLMKQQEADVDSNRMLIQNVKDACRELSEVSGRTLENADSIYNGTGKQEQAISDLKQIMEQLMQELEHSVNSSVDISAATGTTTDKIMETQSQMGLLMDSMQKISEMSLQIEKIIDEINSIAQQTNMLSLNASIEAARAGEMGKGFAVVATQVGELAAKSTQAAKETNDLISNSRLAVEEGQKIAKVTADAFSIVVENIDRSRQGVEEISHMVRQNMDIVQCAVSQLEQISDVVEENVQISQNTKEVSSNMADITGNLLDMIEN